MKNKMLLPMMCLTLIAAFAVPRMFAQDANAAADGDAAQAAVSAPVQPPAQTPATPEVVDNSAPVAKKSQMMQVMFGDALSAILWLALFGTLGFYIYLVVDCSILIRVSKIMPQSLINNVEAAMKEGDVVKALQCCSKEPGAMANILSAGFSHVEEGFDVIQEAIGTAADLEVERIMQKLNWFSVDGNIAPMLGLLGTVQGMIMAFANLASGTPDIAVLAIAISQALWTTAAGLTAAIPCVATFYIFRNKANRIVLRMEAITMELVKDLRNVQVVTE